MNRTRTQSRHGSAVRKRAEVTERPAEVESEVKRGQWLRVSSKRSNRLVPGPCSGSALASDRKVTRIGIKLRFRFPFATRALQVW